MYIYMKGISNTCKYIREMCSGNLLCTSNQRTKYNTINGECLNVDGDNTPR